MKKCSNKTFAMGPKNKKQIAAVDLFCGTGGLTHGLLKGGITVLAGYDIAPNSAYAFEANNNGVQFILKSIEDITPSEISAFFKTDYSLLAGCAPCQPFSQLNNGKFVPQGSWGLLYHFSRLVKYIKPTFVTMENVVQLKKHTVYRDFIDTLRSLNYYINENTVYCPNYGVPQKRKRLVLLASQLGEISIIPPTHSKAHYKTVREAIGNLAPLRAGETDQNDPLHSASMVSPLNLERLKHSKPNGTWKDWPEHLVSPCHKHSKTNNYFNAYGRMAWDEPAPTITTECYGISHGRFGHPEQNRALSLREAALLQSFPQSYKFIPSNSQIRKAAIARMIGNAVPVDLAYAIGRSFLAHMEKYNVSI